jgi:hypothetical protein
MDGFHGCKYIGKSLLQQISKDAPESMIKTGKAGKFWLSASKLFIVIFGGVRG